MPFMSLCPIIFVFMSNYLCLYVLINLSLCPNKLCLYVNQTCLSVQIIYVFMSNKIVNNIYQTCKKHKYNLSPIYNNTETITFAPILTNRGYKTAFSHRLNL